MISSAFILPSLHSARLTLEPILESHAEEMMSILSDPHIHTYMPSNPPDLETLCKRFKAWEARQSPSGDELWLNWIGRLKSDGSAVGHFQAGFKPLTKESSIAYVLGIKHQGQGLATEGMKEVLNYLFNLLQAIEAKAWIDTRNQASMRLVAKLGLKQIEFLPKADHFKGTDSDEYVYKILKDDFQID